LLWHFLAIVLTCISVLSGFDWFYFESFRGSPLRSFLFPAVRLGSSIPIVAPLVFYSVGMLNKDVKVINTAYASGQSVLIGLLIASSYKALTGRAHPPRQLIQATVDISREFHFGFLRGGVFWGWPSSHTSVAFAMTVTILMLYHDNQIVKYLSICYALYVGLAVSMSIHWFSDFMAGAIIGTVIGVVVGTSFAKTL